MYTVNAYGEMIADAVRIDAYLNAMRCFITSESVVLDLGTGTGIFALMACKFGARCVYAIDPDDSIELAREIAAANGFTDRIRFIQALSTEVCLREKADLIVSDIGGILPWFQNHLPSIMDARTRFLSDSGKLMPARDAVWISIVEANKEYNDLTKVWDEAPYELEMGAARNIVVNTWRKANFIAENLVTEPQLWTTLDYAELNGVNASARISWNISEPRIAHGLGMWLDRFLTNGIHFSNSPILPKTQKPLIYGNAFFPWPKPVLLNPNETVDVLIEAKMVGNDYVWRWETLILDNAKETKASFKQTTFNGIPLSPSSLRRRAETHVPLLNEDGKVEQFILERMNGGRTVADIATAVYAKYPERVKNWQAAMNLVSDVSDRFSR